MPERCIPGEAAREVPGLDKGCVKEDNDEDMEQVPVPNKNREKNK
jgi:hypothetical protein